MKNNTEKIVDNVSDVLKICNITNIPYYTLYQIVDIVKLVENKGEKTSLKDIDKLMDKWENKLLIKKVR